MPHILVVDDEPGVRESLRMLLKDEFDVTPAADVDAALALLDDRHVDAVLLDLAMPGRTGIDFLRDLAERSEVPPVIVLSATRTVATAVEAMKLGATDYVTKPFEIDALRIKVRQLFERQALEQEVVRLRDEVAGRSRLGRLIGQSEAMRNVYRTIERAAAARSTVLITGESGTGKELVARALHDLGARRDQRFVVVNCAAIPRDLMESELFGHEKGSFTGATERRLGRFETAVGGTLFLDEIGEMPMELQPKLLRALQERVIERIGGGAPIPVDVRVVAATNRDLEQEVSQGRFRADLFYRIHVVPISMPPLRERREDVRLLAEAFLARARDEAGRGPRRFLPETLAVLERYAWPGNVRELENAIERAVTLTEGDSIAPSDLPDEVQVASRTESLRDAVRAGRVTLDGAVARFESELIREALTRSGWNQTRAAIQMGTTRRQLKLKMDRYGIGASPSGDDPQSDGEASA
jgi:DNA-binding NtrC family response regulator